MQSLTKKKDFDDIYKNGNSSFNKLLGVKEKNNNLKKNRYGIIVGTKISKKAVERNRLKRQIKELIREEEKKLVTGKDIIIYTQPVIMEKNFSEIKKAVNKNFIRLNLYK